MTMMFRQTFAAMVLGFLLILSSAGLARAETSTGIDAVDFPAGSIVIRTSSGSSIHCRAGRPPVLHHCGRKDGPHLGGIHQHLAKGPEPGMGRRPAIRRRQRRSWPDIIPPGRETPWGQQCWCYGDGTYGIHGTNKDATIGTERLLWLLPHAQ